MNLFKKISWMIPALVMTTSLFGNEQDISAYCDPCPKEPPQCDPCYEKSRNKPYDQGHQICEGTLPKAYNAPARIDICDGVDAFITGTFIYWEPLSDQLDLGLTDLTLNWPRDFDVVRFTTDYQPGFKVGLGTHFEHDNWDIFAQYTRLHSNQGTNFNPSTSLSTDFFHTSWLPFDAAAIGSAYQFLLISEVQANWRMDLDKIDLELGRSYYVGTNLITRPYIGGSGHWLDENYSLSFTYDGTPRSVTLKNDSWAIGPRFGINTQWIFYEGFRLFGNAAINLMFSSNKMSGSGISNGTTVSTPFNFNTDKKYVLRNVEELVIGLGWGSYFTSDKWHFDIFAAYEVQRYSHTNYMNKYAQMRSIDSNADSALNLIKPGDTYLHGLTAGVRFDF